MPERVGRWGIARSPALVHDAGGRRAALATAASDRRTWQLIPALVLVVAFIALGVSGLRSEGPVSALASPTATSIAPSITVAPSLPGDSAIPSAAPTEPATPPPTDLPPTAAPSGTTSPRPTRSTYTVKSGDTLYNIARQFGTTVSAIRSVNNLTSILLHPGQVLQIP